MCLIIQKIFENSNVHIYYNTWHIKNYFIMYNSISNSDASCRLSKVDFYFIIVVYCSLFLYILFQFGDIDITEQVRENFF